MLKIKDELFIDIKGYDGRYKIGNKGTIIGISRSNDNRYKNKQWILKQYEDRNGYMYVTLQRNKRRKTIKVHTGITITGISYCANGIRKSGGGYLWHFI